MAKVANLDVFVARNDVLVFIIEMFFHNLLTVDTYVDLIRETNLTPINTCYLSGNDDKFWNTTFTCHLPIVLIMCFSKIKFNDVISFRTNLIKELLAAVLVTSRLSVWRQIRIAEI